VPDGTGVVDDVALRRGHSDGVNAQRSSSPTGPQADSVGAENSVTSCDLQILVEKAAEAVSS
jgi:hypothetical protein